MKRFLTFTLIFAVAMLLTVTFLSTTVSAATEGHYTYTITDRKATITAVDRSISGAVTIPSTLGGYPVTSIGGYAFSNCVSLASVDIPDSVTSIGDWAFEDCKNLTSITIPDSVTSIGYNAFYLCDSLTSVNITNIESWLKIDFANSIANPLYYVNNKNLYLNGKLVTEVFIPKSITELKPYAFFGCRRFTSIEIPDSVTSIGDSAFSNCTSLTSITIPDSVTSIGDSAFSNCTSLTSITIHDSVTSIGEDAFYCCDSLTSVNITNIESWLKIDFANSYANPLYYADNLYSNGELVTEVFIPKSITELKPYAFYKCRSLTSIIIPDSVTSIGESAFWDCTKLTSAIIPNSVKSIGKGAFSYTKLTSITIPDSVTSIGEDAFYCCYKLSSITIGDGVTSIGASAFEYCENLKNVFYSSTEELKNSISIGGGNEYITDAKWHYEVSELIFEGESVYRCGKCEFLYKINGTKVPLNGLSLISPPNKVRYIVGETLDLTGISLQGIYTDELMVSLDSTDITFVNVDLTTPGKKTVRIAIDSFSFAEFEIYVHDMMVHSVDVDPSLYPQSSHNYETDLDDTQTFTYPDAKSLVITFDTQTETENGYDYIYVYDGNGVQIAKFTGTKAANQTLTISGDTFKIRLTSDDSTVKYGYAFSSIKAITGEEIAHNYSEKWTTNETDHWYECTICGDKKDFSEHSVEDGECKDCGKVFYTIGDVDGDEGITANDAIHLLYNVFFGDESYPVDQPCDFDGDNSVTANDAIYLLYHVFFGDESYPLI